MKLSRGRFSHLSSHLWYMIETIGNQSFRPVLPWALPLPSSLLELTLAVTVWADCLHVHPKSLPPICKPRGRSQRWSISSIYGLTSTSVWDGWETDRPEAGWLYPGSWVTKGQLEQRREWHARLECRFEDTLVGCLWGKRGEAERPGKEELRDLLLEHVWWEGWTQMGIVHLGENWSFWEEMMRFFVVCLF